MNILNKTVRFTVYPINVSRVVDLLEIPSNIVVILLLHFVLAIAFEKKSSFSLN